ncbi:unnamed protein product [Amoebophrya sp. A120]|nr:unnamed protein product [Amoebophrya sp. A120]|eukprot:GSA120T00005783001.1
MHFRNLTKALCLISRAPPERNAAGVQGAASSVLEPAQRSSSSQTRKRVDNGTHATTLLQPSNAPLAAGAAWWRMQEKRAEYSPPGEQLQPDGPKRDEAPLCVLHFKDAAEKPNGDGTTAHVEERAEVNKTRNRLAACAFIADQSFFDKGDAVTTKQVQGQPQNRSNEQVNCLQLQGAVRFFLVQSGSYKYWRAREGLRAAYADLKTASEQLDKKIKQLREELEEVVRGKNGCMLSILEYDRADSGSGSSRRRHKSNKSHGLYRLKADPGGDLIFLPRGEGFAACSLEEFRQKTSAYHRTTKKLEKLEGTRDALSLLLDSAEAVLYQKGRIVSASDASGSSSFLKKGAGASASSGIGGVADMKMGFGSDHELSGGNELGIPSIYTSILAPMETEIETQTAVMLAVLKDAVDVSASPASDASTGAAFLSERFERHTNEPLVHCAVCKAQLPQSLMLCNNGNGGDARTASEGNPNGNDDKVAKRSAPNCCLLCADRIRHDRKICPQRFLAESRRHNVEAGQHEKSARSTGAALKSHIFCPHQHRCLACDNTAFVRCGECGLARGGADEVQDLVTKLVQGEQSAAAQGNKSFAHLFLDFDLTLCSTKGGANPLKGAHELDSELVDVIKYLLSGERKHECAEMPQCTHDDDHVEDDSAAGFPEEQNKRDLTTGRVTILTKNPHREEIRSFVQRETGLSVRVVTVPGRSSKREWVAEKLQQGSVVFVDDDINEHAAIGNLPNLWRIHFTRDE